MIQKDAYSGIWDDSGKPLRGYFSIWATILRMLARILKNQYRIEKKIDKINSKLPESQLG